MVIAMAFTAVFFLMLAIRGSTIGVRQYLRHGSADRDGAAFDQLVDGRRIDPRILQYPDAVLADPRRLQPAAPFGPAEGCDAARPGGEAAKLGRASGRERGGQYG